MLLLVTANRLQKEPNQVRSNACGVLSPAVLVGLPAASAAGAVSNEPQKEAIHVVAPRSP